MSRTRELLLTTGIFFSMATVSNALTVEEYNGFGTRAQTDALSRIVVGLHNALAENGASRDKLGCIRALFTEREVQIGSQTVTRTPGVEIVLDQIALANQNRDTLAHLENIVMGVMNAECED